MDRIEAVPHAKVCFEGHARFVETNQTIQPLRRRAISISEGNFNVLLKMLPPFQRGRENLTVPQRREARGLIAQRLEPSPIAEIEDDHEGYHRQSR